MSDNSQVSLAYVEVPNFGDIPVGNPNLIEIPYSGETLKQTNQSQRSANVKSNGRDNDLVRLGYEAGGDINADFTFGDFDDFLAYSLRSPGWSSPVTLTSTGITFTASDQSINRASGDFVADGFAVNGWINVAGAAAAGNNGFMRIVTVAALKITVSSATALVDGVAGPSVTITQGAQIVDGTDLTYVALERHYRSNTTDFAWLSGAIGRVSFRTAKKSQMTVSFQFVGRKEQSSGVTFGDGSNTPETGNPVFTTAANILAILENGVQHDLNSLNLTFDPKIQGDSFLGDDGNTRLRKAAYEASGDMELLYKTGTGATFADKALNFTSSSLIFIFADADGNVYIIDLPKIQPSDAERVGAGKEGDVVLKVPFSCEENVSRDTMVRIIRFPAP